jgi:hypothetical protein
MTDRIAVDATAGLWGEEQRRLGHYHAGFGMTSLPNKKITEPV